MKYTITQDWKSGKYTAWLLDSIDNCAGVGNTPEEALTILKLHYRIMTK